MSIFDKRKKPVKLTNPKQVTVQKINNLNIQRNQKQALKELIANTHDANLDNINDTLDTSINATLGKISGNINFKSQFNLTVRTTLKKNGVIISPSLLDPALQNNLPIFIFGSLDFQGGFLNALNINKLSGWQFLYYVIQGTQSIILTGIPNLEIGDLVLLFSSSIVGDFYQGYVVLHCSQLSYGSLLGSINNTSFKIGQLRYIVNVGDEAQFKNILNITKQSQFGKVSTNFIDPKSYITGNTQNKNISDIPLTLEINESILLSLNIYYLVQFCEFSFMLI